MSINLNTPCSHIFSIIDVLSVLNTQVSGLEKNSDGFERKASFDIPNSGSPPRVHIMSAVSLEILLKNSAIGPTVRKSSFDAIFVLTTFKSSTSI